MKVINDTQKTYNTVIILDYGSQYSKLIARRVRECNVYSEIINPSVAKSELDHLNIKGIILSGGPSDINDSSSPKIPVWLYDFDVPILGICYGLQAIIYNDGGKVSSDSNSEYGNAEINLILLEASLGT